MAEATRYTFSHKEIAEVLVKHQGIHEGLWMLYLEFGIQAANAGPSDDQLLPVAIVPVLKMGLQKSQAMNSLTVDAAVVNPKREGTVD